MALYLLLINLTLLFSFSICAPFSYYNCGSNIIKYSVVKAALDKGCREYYGHQCHVFNCFKNKKLPELVMNNILFPDFDGLHIVWPIVERKSLRRNTIKEIGIVGIDISTNPCNIIGVKYKLEDKLIDCDGVFVNNLLSQQIKLHKSSSSSLRQDRLLLGSHHGSAYSSSLRHKGQHPETFSDGSNSGSQNHYTQRPESYLDNLNSGSHKHVIQNSASLLIDESSDNQSIDITESLRRESLGHGNGSPGKPESWFSFNANTFSTRA